MTVRRSRTPQYRHHRPSGQAVVTLSGRDFYLGKHGTPESRERYDQLLAEWLAKGRTITAPSQDNPHGDLSVSEMILAYLKFAQDYYCKDSEVTGEVTNIKYALRSLRALYGRTPAKEFGPLRLKAVRQKFIEDDLCRNEVNRRTRIIVRAFKWAAGNELIPASVHHALQTVSGLPKGRSEARESEPVKPVPEAFVNAVEPHVSRQVWAMVGLQRLTGMRPGEVVIMRTCDLEMTGQVWTFMPHRHKTAHHGRGREIYLGPAAQAVLRPWLRPDLAAYLFSPSEAVEESLARRRRERRSPMTPSQKLRRRKPKPKKTPGPRYTPDSYREAIIKACDKANVPRWHPNQLRHNAATRLRKEFGLDVARVILGHNSPAVTEIYAEVDREKALAVMEQVG
jgi:integrase